MHPHRRGLSRRRFLAHRHGVLSVRNSIAAVDSARVRTTTLATGCQAARGRRSGAGGSPRPTPKRYATSATHAVRLRSSSAPAVSSQEPRRRRGIVVVVVVVVAPAAVNVVLRRGPVVHVEIKPFGRIRGDGRVAAPILDPFAAARYAAPPRARLAVALRRGIRKAATDSTVAAADDAGTSSPRNALARVARSSRESKLSARAASPAAASTRAKLPLDASDDLSLPPEAVVSETEGP